MEIKTKKLSILSQARYQLIDITEKAEQAAAEVKDGLIFVFVPHSTAAVLLTEHEEGLKKDWLGFLKKLVSGQDFKHNLIDDNADSHILSGLLGQGKLLPIENNKLVRGAWQQVFLAEFDGPKTRKVIFNIIGF